MNLRVGNLMQLFDELKTEGAAVNEKIEEYGYGKIGWILGPEGNRIEPWEPGDEKL